MRVIILSIIFVVLIFVYFLLPTNVFWVELSKSFSFSDLISILVAVFIWFMLPHIVNESIKKRETKSDFLLKQLDNIDNSFENLWNIVNNSLISSKTNKQYLSLFKKVQNDIDYFLGVNERLWFIVKKEKWLEFNWLYYKCRTEVGEYIEEEKYAEALNRVSTFQKEIRFLKEDLIR